jgi:hypothetical protein
MVLGTTVAAYAAGVFGIGTLSGWTVIMDGEEVCSDPAGSPAPGQAGLRNRCHPILQGCTRDRLRAIHASSLHVERRSQHEQHTARGSK